MNEQSNVMQMLFDYLSEHVVDADIRHELNAGDLLLLAQEGLVAEHVRVVGPGTPFERTELTLSLPSNPDIKRLLDELLGR